MKQIAAILAGLAFGLLAVPAGAAMYKWVDADGKVHYSQTPPANERFEQLREQPRATEQPAPAAAPPAASSAQPPAGAESAEATCRDAKHRLAALEDAANAGRLVVKQDDGTMHKLSEEERLNYIIKTREQIEASCK